MTRLDDFTEFVKASCSPRPALSDKHSALSDIAKRAVDPAIKAASLAMLAKAGGVI